MSYILANTAATLRQLHDAFKTLKAGDILDIDLETNGLHPWTGNEIIGYAFGFEKLDKWFYVPVRHGYGEFEVDDKDTPWEELTWASNDKVNRWLNYWTSKMVVRTDKIFGNIEEASHERVIRALNLATNRGVTWRGHNIPFDMAFLAASDWVVMPSKIIDTMTGLHTLHEDLGSIEISAPLKWSKRHVKAGRCNNAHVGHWARDEEGQPIWEDQLANKELKFMSAAFEVPGAMEGEEELVANIRQAEKRIRTFMDAHKSDPMWSDKAFTLSEKSNMWALTGEETARYAAGDVKLTCGLYHTLVEKHQDWGTLPVWEADDDVLRWSAFEMHYWGFKLDRDELAKQQAVATERGAELFRILERWVAMYAPEQLVQPVLKRRKVGGQTVVEKIGEKAVPFNANSPTQLLAVLQAFTVRGVWAQAHPELGYPSWWDTQDLATLRTYEKVKFKPKRRGKLDDTPQEAGVERGYYTPKNFMGTDEQELKPVKDHPFVQMLVLYRKMVKTVSTYLNNWDKAADEWDIVHPEFKFGTVSGRYSSSGDAGNLQNIPTKGWQIKRCVTIPWEGWALVGIDYSQLELRLATWFAEHILKLDPNMPMTTQFLTGDPHAYTRDQIGIQEYLYPGASDSEVARRLGLVSKKGESDTELVKGAMRDIAKTLNFGLLYSGGKGMMATALNISESSADLLVKAWRELYPAFPEANRKLEKAGLVWRPLPRNPKRSALYLVQPIIGRVRHLSQYKDVAWYKDEDGEWRQYNEKEANARKDFNWVIQGMGGGMANRSGARCRKELGPDLFRPVFLVHDEVAFYTPIETKDAVIGEVSRIMCDWDVVPRLSVGVKFSTTNWQDMEKWVK